DPSQSPPAENAESRPPASGAEATAGDGPAEQRKAVRLSGNWLKVFLKMDGQAEEFEAWLVDCAPHGLGLNLFQEVAPGSRLGVRPAKAPATVPWVQVEVKYCRHRDGDTWSAGCHFVDISLWSTLLQYS